MQSPEIELSILLRGMSPELGSEVLVYVTVPESQLKSLQPPPLMSFREAEGETIVLPKWQAQRLGLPFEFPCRMITLSVFSSLNAVGFLANVLEKLAVSGIPVNAVSAFHHDHLLIPENQALEALSILKTMTLEA